MLRGMDNRWSVPPYCPPLDTHQHLSVPNREEEAGQLGLQGDTGTPGGPMYSQITIVCWAGKSSIAILVDKATSAQLAARLEYAMRVLEARTPAIAAAQ